MNLFILLSIAIVCLYLTQPKDIEQIWLISILVPVLTIIAITVILSVANSPDLAGLNFSKAVWTIPVTIALLHLSLKERFEKENKVLFQTILVIILILSLIYSSVTFFINRSYDNAIEEYETQSFSELKSNQLNLTEKSEYKTFTYKNLSFNHESSWNINSHLWVEEDTYQVICSKPDSSIIVIIWNSYRLSEDQNLKESISGLKSDYPYKLATFSNIYKSTFHEYSCYRSDYQLSNANRFITGRILSFVIENQNMIIMEQAESKDRLERDFKTIEESLNIN